MRSTIKATLSARRVEILLFVLLWLTYAYFYQSTQHNGAARFDQTRAIVEKGVLYIDEFRYNTADVVEIAKDGGPKHIYPNKAPGTSLFAVPQFWFWMRVLQLGVFHSGRIAIPDWKSWHFVAYFTILTTVGLLSVLAAIAMFAILRRLTGDIVFSTLAVVAIWLGTICFPFSTLFFSHQQAAAQLVLAFYFLFKLRHDGPDTMRWPLAQMLLAGFLCGFTIATEYPTLLLVALLCVYFGITLLQIEGAAKRRARLAVPFAFGLAAGLSILAAYNLAVAGKMFFIPYAQYAKEGADAAFPGHAKGAVGVHWPGWRNFLFVLKEITIAPQRGLLYIGFEGWRVYACNPVLWLALPGLIWLFKRNPFRLEAGLVASMAVAYFTFNACFGDSIVYWGGAWSVGPRHLIPLLPFLALPLIEGARRLWFLFYPLLLISVFYMLLATAVEPRVPYEFSNPARSLFLANHLRGYYALNLEGLPNRSPNRPRLTANSNAFNLAKLARYPGACQLWPLLAFWLIGGTCLIWAAWAKPGGMEREGPGENEDRGEKNGGAQASESAGASPEIADPGAEGIGTRLLQPRFSPLAATAVLVLFVVIIAVVPPLHRRRMQRELATPGGLTGTYHRGSQPVFVRKDTSLDFDWTLDPPLPWPFGVAWTGTIRFDRPGRYLFATESDDGSGLLIGRTVVVNNDGIHGRRRRMGRPVDVEKPLVSPIRISYSNYQLAGFLRVTWQPPGEPETVIPADVLSPKGVGENAP